MDTDTDLLRRSFPILIESSTVSLVWIEAESHAAALAYARQDPWDLPSTGEAVDLGGLSARIPDEIEHWHVTEFDEAHGPALLCATCGVSVWGGPGTTHDLHCPDRPRYDRGPGWVGPRDSTRALAGLFEALIGGPTGLQSVELDYAEITLTVSIQSDAHWTTWMQMAGAEAKTERRLATYRTARGELGRDQHTTSVRTTLIGLTAPADAQ